MKLQAKFTIAFIVLVVFTTLVSFFLINWNLQSQFNRFIEERNQEQRGINPLSTFSIPKSPRETPEQRFSRTVSESLWLAAGIDIGVAILLAFFMSGLLLQRIQRLKISMQQYMKDGTSKPVFHEGNDEVDDLAKMYNLLIQKIENEEKIRKDFFIDMSHELRTPLTSLKGYLEGLMDNVFEQGKEKDIHKKTLHETERMIHLVNEMTALAKLETGKPKLTLHSTNLRHLTDEVVDIMSAKIQDSQLKLDINGEAFADVDPYKFKQVFINLIDNALHYAKKPSTVTIEIGKTEKEVYWRIKNKTEGISPEQVSSFFERFYRGDKSRRYEAQKPHLGIGLNIVKKIIELHKGTILAQLDGNVIVFEVVLPQK